MIGAVSTLTSHKKNFRLSSLVSTLFIIFAADKWCPYGLNREPGVNPGQFPLL